MTMRAKYLRPPPFTNKADLRAYILQEQNGQCFWCGITLFLPCLPPYTVPNSLLATLDHLRSRAEGGGNEPWNLVVACGPCNQNRGCSPLNATLAWIKRLHLWKISSTQPAIPA